MITGLLFIVLGAYLKTKVCQILRGDNQAEASSSILERHIYEIVIATRRPTFEYAPGYEVKG